MKRSSQSTGSVGFDRRTLWQTAGVGGLAMLGLSGGTKAFAAAPRAPALKLGLASYSLRKLSVDQLIQACAGLGLKYLTLKDMHLPREPKELEAAVSKYKAAGITVMGAGVIYMKNEPEKVRKDFEYARAAGVPLIVAAPDPDALDLVEGLVKEFNMPVAIHNHGPEDNHYPGPSDVMKLIQKRDKRMGVCMDIGHTLRAGEDPVALVHKLGARLFDLHVKDLKDPKDKGSQVESGKGIMDLVGLCKALQKRKFAGQVGLEYEINENDPLPGIRESLAYLRGVIAGIGA